MDYDGSYYLVPISIKEKSLDNKAYSIGEMRKRNSPAKNTGSSDKTSALSGAVTNYNKQTSRESQEENRNSLRNFESLYETLDDGRLKPKFENMTDEDWNTIYKVVKNLAMVSNPGKNQKKFTLILRKTDLTMSSPKQLKRHTELLRKTNLNKKTIIYIQKEKTNE